MAHFFVPFVFYFYLHYVLNSHMFSVSANSDITFPRNSSFINPITSPFFPQRNGSSNLKFEVSNIASISFAISA